MPNCSLSRRNICISSSRREISLIATHALQGVEHRSGVKVRVSQKAMECANDQVSVALRPMAIMRDRSAGFAAS